MCVHLQLVTQRLTAPYFKPEGILSESSATADFCQGGLVEELFYCLLYSQHHGSDISLFMEGIQNRGE